MISACEWVFGNRPTSDVLATLTASGCDAVELSGEPERQDIEALLSTLRSSGLAVSGVTPLGRWPTEERDLSHPNPIAREKAIGYYKGCVDLATLVGAPSIGLITVGVGRLAPLSDGKTEWQYALEGTREVAKYASSRAVSVGIEALNRYETYMIRNAAQALEFADAVGLDNVGVILDLFHMNIEEDDISASVRAAAERMLALHVADSNRSAPGQGHSPVAEVVRSAVREGFKGPFVLECTASGYDPFAPDKSPAAMQVLDESLTPAVTLLRNALDEA